MDEWGNDRLMGTEDGWIHGCTGGWMNDRCKGVSGWMYEWVDE